MPLRLSFENGPLAGVHVVTAATLIRLGRDPEVNDIVLTSPTSSRRHAMLERSVVGGYSIQVLSSGQSTLNGDPLVSVGGRPTVASLASGDRVDLGGVQFVVDECEVKLICVAGPSVG